MAWMHYNPQRVDAALLDSITAGESRLRLRDELLAAVRAETTRTSHQHQLLIGPRGAGKTHLLRVVAHRIRQDPELGKAWWPVVLAEEQGLRGASDLFTALVSRLASDLDGTAEAAARAICLETKALVTAAGRGLPAMTVAYGGLAKAAAAMNRRVVVIVENLDALFYLGVSGGKKDAANEQWALRKYLQDAAHLLLIGAAPTYFGAASEPDAAFHGFFREHTLDALPLDEVLGIAKQHLEVLVSSELDEARRQRAQELIDRFDERKGRLAGMLRVTGGLPRFAHLIVELLVDSSDADSEVQLERLLDEQTPYFQGRLDPRLIPAGELELLATLARAAGPLRPSEAARRIGLSSGEVAVMLERLRERGLARRSGSHGGATAWDVAEPLYRVWMAFREGGEQRTGILALGEVVAALYDQDELEAQLERTRRASRPGSLGERLLDTALRFEPLPLALGDTLGTDEERYQHTKHALEQARSNGLGVGQALVQYLEHAVSTGRLSEAAPLVDEAIAASASDDELSARAHHWAGYAVADASKKAGHYAAAVALYGKLGMEDLGMSVQGNQAQALAMAGQQDEAKILLSSALGRATSAGTRSWLKLLLGVYGENTVAARCTQFNEALRLADDNSIPAANAHYALAQELPSQGRLTHTLAALDIYKRNGWHRESIWCHVACAKAFADERAVDDAARSYFDAIDVMLEFGVPVTDAVWNPLVALATWHRSLAGRALRVIAAATNLEGELRKPAEAKLIAAAVQLIALGPRDDETVQLLVDARGDLLRDRRTLLEPFVLAARIVVEGPESVLLEQSEQMRGVIDDVMRRVKKVRAKPPAKPDWLTKC